MILSKPIWSPANKTYTINILNHGTITYAEVRSTYEPEVRSTSGNNFLNEPDINKKEFQELFTDFIKVFIEFSKGVFSTPIKDTIFTKRSKHIFKQISKTNNYGEKCLITWKPIKIIITSTNYEIYWDFDIVVLDNTINSENITLATTNIIEPAEEIQEITTISPEQDNKNISRSLMKKKVREARLKVAIAKLKAEKLAAKYFRRYGDDLDVEYESDLSSDSDSN